MHVLPDLSRNRMSPYPITVQYRKWQASYKPKAMASTTAESKATNSVSNGVASGIETISKTITSQSLVKRGGSSSASQLINWKRILEVVVLSCVIVAAWGLFSVPTIVYAVPPRQVSYYSYS